MITSSSRISTFLNSLMEAVVAIMTVVETVSALLDYALAIRAGEETIVQLASSLISTSVDISAPSIKAHAGLVTPFITIDTSAVHASKATLVLLVLSLFALATAALLAHALLQECVLVIEERWARIVS